MLLTVEINVKAIRVDNLVSILVDVLGCEFD